MSWLSSLFVNCEPSGCRNTGYCSAWPWQACLRVRNFLRAFTGSSWGPLRIFFELEVGGQEGVVGVELGLL